MHRQSIPHRMQFSRLDDMTSIRLQTRNPGTQPQSCEFKDIKIGADNWTETVYCEVCVEMPQKHGEVCGSAGLYREKNEKEPMAINSRIDSAKARIHFCKHRFPLRESKKGNRAMPWRKPAKNAV